MPDGTQGQSLEDNLSAAERLARGETVHLKFVMRPLTPAEQKRFEEVELFEKRSRDWLPDPSVRYKGVSSSSSGYEGTYR